MNKPLSTTRIVLAAVLLSGASACMTTRDAGGDATLQRAYERGVQVTGSRIRQPIGPDGRPAVAYQVDTFHGVDAQEIVRGMRLRER
jgi:hypothetical protein